MVIAAQCRIDTKTLQHAVSGVVANAADLLSSLANILLDTVIVLILSFYMMLDGPRIINGLMAA